MYASLQREWFSNLRGDILAGIVVALALIPEAIAFSIIAGVDPKVGLYASFCIAVVSAFAGGRPGMISAATGAMSLLMVTLVKDHGLQYLLAATLLTGVLQILAGFLKLGELMRFVSRSGEQVDDGQAGGGQGVDVPGDVDQLRQLGQEDQDRQRVA